MIDRIGNCRIISEIGSGGMAIVYKAVQEPLGRAVAVKALKPSIAVDSTFAERFEREAHFMASLQHENILHVYDFVKDQGTMSIVMEYVRGIDLYDLLEMTPRLPAEVAAIIALKVVRALDYAHFRGIIHRDIKPANVMISHQGEIKLMDFGIARDDNLRDLTETGTGLGTPSYMSPEQILGDRLDFRSDIFALGIVLYQMLTGRKPFVEDETRSVMQKIRLDAYTPPRRINATVPRPLERILARCMEKMPTNRYQSTQALIDDLMDFLAPRVETNHNARVVLYLRELGIISQDQADEILSAGETARGRPAKVDKRLLPHVWIAQGGALAAMLLGGLVIQLAYANDEGSGAAFASGPSIPDDAGYVRFIAHPWADVFVDGHQVVTTPSAHKLALSPGRHWVAFRHPFLGETQREVVIEADKTYAVRVDLTAADDQTSGDPDGGAPVGAKPNPEGP